MNRKEMRDAINGWLAGIPGREWNKNFISKAGTKYVTIISLYEGSRATKEPIEDFYRDHEHVIRNCIYQH